jgi:chromosomal replication initiation ATPase DnaA
MTLLEHSHKPRRRRRPRVRFEIAHPCRLMEQAVATTFAIPADELRAASRRTAGAAFARQSAMYLAHVAMGLSLSVVGRVFRRHRTTAAYACQLVERRRDDPDVDRLLAMLECVCADLARDLHRRRVRP